MAVKCVEMCGNIEKFILGRSKNTAMNVQNAILDRKFLVTRVLRTKESSDCAVGGGRNKI